MWKRSYWVLMTYLKRPMFWWLVAITATATVVLMVILDNRIQNVDEDSVSPRAIRTLQQLDATLAHNPNQPVELDYGSLHSQVVQELFVNSSVKIVHIGETEQATIHAKLAKVEELQRVVSLHAGYAVDQATIDRFSKFRTLKRLSILADLGYSSIDLKSLNSLLLLEDLQLGLVQRLKSLEPLSSLPRLKKLGIDNPMVLEQHGFTEIANLSQLAVLSLPDLESLSKFQEINLLSQSKSLKEIRYNVTYDEPEKIARLQGMVLGIRVTATRFKPARHWVLFWVLLATALAFFPAMHAVGQFSLPVSYLSPRFRFEHYFVACLWLALLNLFLIGVLIKNGANVLTSLSIVLIFTSLHFWAGTQIAIVNLKQQSAFLKVLNAMPGIIPLLVLVSRIFDPTQVDYLLTGSSLLFAFVCVGSSIWMLRSAYFNLESRLTKQHDEGLPAILSMPQLQAFGASQRARNRSESSERDALDIGKKLPFIAKAALAITIFSFAMHWCGFQVFAHIPQLTCILSLEGCVMLIGLKWWREMPYFAAAIVRPPSRMDHINRLLRGVAADFLAMAPLLLATVLVLSSLETFSSEGIGFRIFDALVVVASITTAIYAAILWILAVRTIAGIALFAIIFYLPCSLIVVELGLLGQMSSPLYLATAISFSGLAVIAFSAVAIHFARRYYARIEWASFYR